VIGDFYTARESGATTALRCAFYSRPITLAALAGARAAAHRTVGSKAPPGGVRKLRRFSPAIRHDAAEHKPADRHRGWPSFDKELLINALTGQVESTSDAARHLSGNPTYRDLARALMQKCPEQIFPDISC